MKLPEEAVAQLVKECAKIKLSGRRNLVRVLCSIDLKHTKRVMDVITEKIKCSLPDDGKLTASSSRVVIAPPRAHVNWWTPGPIHRDCDTELPGYLSILVLMNDVGQKNGSVKLWPGTQHTTLNDRDPNKSVAGKEFVYMTGKKGTAFVFDSRLLHRSVGNQTETACLKVQWFCNISAVRTPVVAPGY